MKLFYNLYKKSFFLLVFFLIFYYNNSYLIAFTTETVKPEDKEKSDFAGEFFGIKVPKENYYFVKGVISIFGKRSGGMPQTPEELEEEIWEELLLSFVAYNQNITVSEEEVEKQINQTLQAENVNFNWQKDALGFENWLKERAGITPQLFKNQIRHRLQLDKLRQVVIERIQPQVSEEEALNAFLDENNMLSLELAQFETEEAADNFYKKVNGRPEIWEKEKKKNPKDFRQISLVTVIFLIDFWKIPREALYKMLKKEIGEFYPPRPIYKGYAVFKILDKKVATEKDFNEEAKNAYSEKVKSIKKYEGFNTWLKKLKEEAKIKVYQEETNTNNLNSKSEILNSK